MTVRAAALAAALVLSGEVGAAAPSPGGMPREKHVVSSSDVQADRNAPPEVPPVEHGGVRYQQDLDGAELGGRLAAVDPRTGRRLWVLDVYHVEDHAPAGVDSIGRYFRTMALSPEGTSLLIEDEAGLRYAVDLATRHVRPLDGERERVQPKPAAKPKPKP